MDCSNNSARRVEEACPDRSVLERLLLGRVSGEEVGPLEEHVRDCGQCAAVMATIQAADPLIEAVRTLPQTTEDPDDTQVAALVEALCKLPVTLSSSGHRPSLAETTEQLAPFLDPPEEPGELGWFGPYRVIGILGSGGMGIALEAEEPELERRVALKVMNPALATSRSARERFLREARTAASIDHDHVVAIYRVGEHRDLPFLAMPLLKGESLADRLRNRGKLEPNEVVRIGRQIAAALAAAHQQGVVHRDVKPDNVWLEAEPNEDRAKILDFGLARAVDDDVRLTRQGVIAGTPAYMAPEQAHGGPVDERADLFSLGCVLYEMCTGRAPFTGSTTASLLLAVTRHHPPAPHRLDPRVPKALSDLIMKLLKKAPARRVQTAREVLDLLERCPRSSEASAGWPLRWQLKITLAAVVAAIGLMALTVIYLGTGEGRVMLSIDPSDVTITVDGKETRVQIEDGALVIVVPSGKRRIAISKPGFAPRVEQLWVLRGGRRVLTVEFNPAESTGRSHSRGRALRVEPPEDRLPLCRHTVTNTLDSGAGSLRQAILDANANPGTDVIDFNVPTSDPGYHSATGAFTIQPLSALPEITDPITIDGYTQPGASPNDNPASQGLNGVLKIELDGSRAGDDVNGLMITAGGSTVRGLVVNRFAGNGIALQNGEGNAIEGCYVGTDVTGSTALANAQCGVAICDGAQSNCIGTDGDGIDDPAERNVISGNSSHGVAIYGEGTDSNVVAGNYVGIDVSGAVALGNGFGSGGRGVAIYEGAKSNLIGTDGDGVADAAERNVISANRSAGVLVSGTGSNGNVVAGNYIGTDSTGTIALGNHLYGVLLVDWEGGPQANLVGTNGDGLADEAERNVVSGNRHHGVLIVGAGTDSNVVAGNYIGTDVSGTTALGNGFAIKWGYGVLIQGAALSNRIGTNGDGVADTSERNVISGNAGNGVGVADANTNHNVVAGNFIGTDASGTAALGNGNHGIKIEAGASWNRVGTNGDGVADTDERNVISGNGNTGVAFQGDGAVENVVAGNFIGTDVTGNVAIGNGAAGVGIWNGVQRTLIGTNGDGLADADERNLISGNLGYGVDFSGSTTRDNLVAGNYIGTDASGAKPLGNGQQGVYVRSFNGCPQANQIGGSAALANTIAYNGSAGVALVGEDTTGNSIRANSIYENGTLGIDLNEDGVTLNDPGDADTGPNGLQNYPLISLVVPGGSTRVVGTLNSTPNSQFTLDFYANTTPDPFGFDEGQRWLGSTLVTTDGAADADFDVVLPSATTAGESVTATATDAGGNTSEFFQGDLDEVAFYARPLSAAEVAEHYRAGVCPHAPGVANNDDARVDENAAFSTSTGEDRLQEP